jgi:hypothetical protein
MSRCFVRVSVDGVFHTVGKSWVQRGNQDETRIASPKNAPERIAYCLT